MFSITGWVATVLFAGNRGFAGLERTSGFAARLVPISAPAEASVDFGCAFFMGTPSLTVGTRFGRLEGSGFCVVLGLSAWGIMPGCLGFEDFGANDIASGCGREVGLLPRSSESGEQGTVTVRIIAKMAGDYIAQLRSAMEIALPYYHYFGLSNEPQKTLEYLVIRSTSIRIIGHVPEVFSQRQG